MRLTRVVTGCWVEVVKNRAAILLVWGTRLKVPLDILTQMFYYIGN